MKPFPPFPHSLRFLPAVCLLLLAATTGWADPPKHAEWELTFRDEFEGTTVDWGVWESEKGARGVNKLEGRWPENNVVKDGLLRQVTRQENPPRGGKSWSSAHIWTRAFTQQYGYFECRLRYGRYLNNAFWLYRPRGRFRERPHFEIDVNEGHTPREVAMTFHFEHYAEGDDQGEHHSTGTRWDAPVDLDRDFHVYAVEWDEKRIVWYYDGTPVRVLENPNAHAPADVRLSTVIMENQVEKDKVALDTMQGVTMEVDWVRVYRKVRDLAAPQLPTAERYVLPEVVKREKQIDAGGKRTTLFEERFDTTPVGQLPAGWEVGDKAPAVAEDSPANGKAVIAPGNRLLRLMPGDYLFRLFDTPITGRIEIELDYLSSTKDPGLLLVTLGQFDQVDPVKRRDSYYTGGIGPYIHWQRSYVSFYTEAAKWTYFAPWQPKRWRKERFILDIEKGIFDYYGPDGEFVSGGLFRGKQKAAHGIGLRNRGERWPVYVDNVVVRKIE